MSTQRQPLHLLALAALALAGCGGTSISDATPVPIVITVVVTAAPDATLAPTEISERARELDRDLLRLKDVAPARVHPAITTALALARASRAGGIAAARANLALIEDDAFRKQVEDRLDRKLTPSA